MKTIAWFGDHTCNLSAGRLRQEDYEFKSSLNCVVRPCFNTKQEIMNSSHKPKTTSGGTGKLASSATAQSCGDADWYLKTDTGLER